jgi:hypothetical protein
MLVHMCIYQGRPSVAFQDPAAVAFRGGQRTTSGCKSDEGARAVSGFARRLRGSADAVEYQEDELFRAPLAEGGGERELEFLWERANSCLFATMGVAEER